MVRLNARRTDPSYPTMGAVDLELILRSWQTRVMTQVLAHRGASQARPENTVAAFELAVEMGADAIELDVRQSADGVLVIHHDPVLSDGTVISGVDASRLPADIPTLERALAACGSVAVNVEIKHDPAVTDEVDHDDHVDAVMDALIAFDGGQLSRRWLISSFRYRTVERVADRHRMARTAWLVETIDQAAIDRTAAAGFDGINPQDLGLTRSHVDAAHRAGLQMSVWTVDDPERLSTLIGWGVDGVFTNVPDLALTLRSGRSREIPIQQPTARTES